MGKASFHAIIIPLLVLGAYVQADDGDSGAEPRALNTILTERHVLSVGFADQKVDARVRATPEGSGAYNPAFDVTPNDLITAFITEHGVLRPPFRESLAVVLAR